MKVGVRAREVIDKRRAVAGFDGVNDLVQILPRLVLRNLPVLAFVLQPPRLRLRKIVGLRKGLAGHRIDPAGDDVNMLMVGVAVGDKNRLRILHAKGFQKPLACVEHFVAGSALPLLP